MRNRKVSLRTARKCITGRAKTYKKMHEDRRLWGWWVCIEILKYGDRGIERVRILGVGSREAVGKVYDKHDTVDRKHELYLELVFDPARSQEVVTPAAFLAA